MVLRGRTGRGELRAAMKRRPRSGKSEAKALARPDLLGREKLARVPSQRRSRIKREALLRAGVELFERHGYEATAIGDIVGRAQTSVRGFYQYFRSKRQLLLVLMNELLQKLEHIDMQPSGEGDLRSAIESVLRAGLSTDLAYAGAYRAWREAMLSDAQLAALDERVRAWTTGRLRAIFEMLAQLPGGRRGVDIPLFAALMDRLFWDLLASTLRSNPRVVETLGHIIYYSLLDDSD
jgi:AcrR family transcriptional regulator